MPQKRYKFNPQTSTYEAIATPFRIKFYRFLRTFLLASILASLVTMVMSYFFYTPKMSKIVRERSDILSKMELLEQKIGVSSEALDRIQVRDKYVYRNLFGLDTLRVEGVYSPYPESKYKDIQAGDLSAGIKSLWMELDALSRRAYAASVSIDQLQPLANDKGKMAESIPAIWPLDKNQYRNLDYYGLRRDPITGARGTMHSGMDFSGNIGTPIYATGNGVVSDVVRGYGGMGRYVTIDHGFGYKTRYGHLSSINVVKGQIVKRGEKIAEMGMTGTRVTGPHLHYEVHYRDNKVDPMNYFHVDMSDEDFAAVLENATVETFQEGEH